MSQPNKQGPGKATWLRAAGVGLLASGVFGLCACSSASSRADLQHQDQKSEATPIAAIQVKEQSMTRVVEVVGTLWPDDQVIVSSQVEGQVEKILVDVGDAVETGQAMVGLNTEELRYQVEQRTANVRKIMAQLGLTDEKGEVKDVTELPGVKKAAATLFDAEQRYRRSRDLFNQALTPRQDLDTAESRYLSAKADYDVVLQQVNTLQAELRSERAQLSLTQKKLRDTQIRAPFAGFVQERHVSPGQYLRVQAPVMTIVKPSPLKLRADVPEKMASWIRPGQNVDVSGEAFPKQLFSGQIRRITPAVKEQSRSFTIEAIIANPHLVLKPGVFVRAKVTTSKEDSVLLVSEDALNYLFGVYKVLVVEDGRLREREVKLGDRFDGRVEVKEGIVAGAWVALHPEKLKEGMAVRIENSRQP